MNDEDYLGTTLNAFERELFPAESRMSDAIAIFVVNVHGAGHKRFDEAKERFSANAAFRFSEQVEDPALTANRVDPPHVAGNANRPGWRVRKQTRTWLPFSDLKRSEVLRVREDDMALCDHGFRAMTYT